MKKNTLEKAQESWQERITNPFERLACAIIVRAIEDYLNACLILEKQPEDPEAQCIQKDIERFIHSEFYQALSAIDGGYLLRLLKNAGEAA